MVKENRIGKSVGSVMVFLLALFVVGINISLAFDNVVWGDEAFSANVCKSSFSGILQILYYCDNHPPLYYFWLKIFGDLFGHKIYIYHFASLVPFILSEIFAVTFFRKRLGNMPAAFLVAILGLGYFCIEYNLEIRMYSLAFLGVMMTFYCSYMSILSGKKSAYIGMVIWAWVAAYSHYYGLVTVGILMFVTTVVIWIINRGKTFLKGVLAMVVFLIGYGPWFYFLFTAMKNINTSWWMTDILGLEDTLGIVLGGYRFNWMILGLLVIFCGALLVLEKGKFSKETYVVMVGLATIIVTIGFAYFLCFTYKPMLAQRYMYPLSAVTFGTFIVAMSRVFLLFKEYGFYGGNIKGKIVKAVVFIILLMFLFFGMGNFKVHKNVIKDQDIKTKATLNLIGDNKEDALFVTNGVKHLGWTIFPCYFPKTEFVNGTYYAATKDKFWYFNLTPISDEEIGILNKIGYEVTSYGQMQIAQYVFSLYYMEK